MEYYAIHLSGESLSHHGIAGQRWGVRNGPPYPLGEGQHSKRELRAMKKADHKSKTESSKAETEEKMAESILKEYRSDPEYKKQVDRYLTNYYFEELIGIPPIGYEIGGTKELDDFYTELSKYIGGDYLSDPVSGDNLLRKEIKSHIMDSNFPKKKESA